MSITEAHERMREQLTESGKESLPDVELSFRAMFGGMMGYADGKPFASLSNIGLALKIAPGERSELLALPGAKRLRYEPDAPESKQYIVLPDTVTDSPEQLAAWMRRSVDFAASQPKPKSKTKPQ